MKKFLKITAIILLGVLASVLLMYHGYYHVLAQKAKKHLAEVQVLEIDGYSFRDLNKNGVLDVYEDARRDIASRVEDLLSQMTLEEKIGLMWHPHLGAGRKGEILGKPSIRSANTVSTWDVLVNRKINHFNLYSIPQIPELAMWHNRLQKIAEQTRLGIPVTISTDPRHGIRNFIGGDMLGGDFSKWPEPIGLAAIGDSITALEFGRIAREEYLAVGIRTALHPMADISTEPRWARINGTFGEDAYLSAKLTAAYIYGFQGDSLGPWSVACMTKHWPGGGPQEKGEDAHFGYGKRQIYPGNNFAHHLIPFEAALKAGTAMMMPYYGIAMGQTSEDVGMSFNKELINGLLRNDYGYDGIVCTDWSIVEGMNIFGYEIVETKAWGVEHLTISQRIEKAIDAGVDQFGGNMNTYELVTLVREGLISEDRIDESARRLLRAKFIMGLFDNPYVDEQKAIQVVGNESFVEKGKLAQRQSMVLLKNSTSAHNLPVLPLTGNEKIYIENIDKELASVYATVVDQLADADFALIRLEAPWQPRKGDFIEQFFHQGDLDFKEPELSRILGIMKEKPTIVCIYLDRPAVIPEIAEHAAALFADFGVFDDAVLDLVFGKFQPGGRLPFEMASSMQAVKLQKEDVPFDSQDPLFPFGHGLQYQQVAVQ
jgi:beta-glucosidase